MEDIVTRSKCAVGKSSSLASDLPWIEPTTNCKGWVHWYREFAVQGNRRLSVLGTKKGKLLNQNAACKAKWDLPCLPESSDLHSNTGEITALRKGIRCGANPKLDYKQ